MREDITPNSDPIVSTLTTEPLTAKGEPRGIIGAKLRSSHSGLLATRDTLASQVRQARLTSLSRQEEMLC